MPSFYVVYMIIVLGHGALIASSRTVIVEKFNDYVLCEEVRKELTETLDEASRIFQSVCKEIGKGS